MRGALHHVEIYVKDLEISRKFWGWLLERLGYTVFQEWDRGISYILGETYLVFVQVESRFLDVPYHRCRAGLNHLAFHGESREFIDGITETLRGRGVTVLYEDKHPFAGGKGSYAVFFEDPDRMKVEITVGR